LKFNLELVFFYIDFKCFLKNKASSCGVFYKP
jgi:hypothetical protein